MAIEAIDRLPEEWRALSDQNDMLQLLEALQPNRADMLRVQARATLQRRGIDDADGKMVVADRDANDQGVIPLR
jgi:hypothetical protein